MRHALALVLLLAACAPKTFHSVPSVQELNTLAPEDLYARFPELDACSQANAFFAIAPEMKGTTGLVDAWGEPDETSISAWNLLVWIIPLGPASSWQWTRFERDVEITVARPLALGYRPAVWMCDFGPLRVR